MQSEMEHAFIQQLTDDTRKHRLEWHYMDQFTDSFKMLHTSNPEYPAPFPGLYEDEFHQIDYHRSYACMSNAGVIYLFFAHSYSGLNTDSKSEFSLSIHPMPYDLKYYCNVYADQGELFKLETAIRKHMEKADQYWINNQYHFISLYLSYRDPEEYMSARDDNVDN